VVIPSERERIARFEAIFDESYEALLAYARRRVGGEGDDVVAETLTIAWRRIDAVPSDPLPWLFGVARKVISGQRRAIRRRAALVERIRRDPAATDPSGGPILTALERLTARDREAILLVAWEGLSAEHAAEAMGTTAVAFRVRLHRARKRLRAQLDQLDGGVSPKTTVVVKEAKST
jgi:RNA polymerase sigma-70 factor (ECF subfamily)